jgi:SpoVK/Ycf46/Vps4 family AAA+-type ATPase
MTVAAIGPLFPLGGPVPPELIIGRRGDIEEIQRRLGEGLSTMLVGPRRIGKTTVCAAACQELKESGAVVVEVDVPERPDSQALLQLIVDACSRISLEARGRAALRVARPTIEKILSDRGIPLDLSSIGAAAGELPIRTVLGLPAELARSEKRRALLFLDELQRVVDYADGDVVLRDLVDLYAGSRDAVVLVDGSDVRALDGMFGAPAHFGKLVDRLTLDAQIPLASWRAPLTDRFASAGLVLPDEARERILTWSGGRPYATIAAARYAALSARKTASTTVADFDVQMGIDEAERHLADDGV